MGEPTAPTGGDTIPGPIPRDPPPPPGYVDPLDESPVLEGLVEETLGDDDRPMDRVRPGPAEPRRQAEEQPHPSP